MKSCYGFEPFSVSNKIPERPKENKPFNLMEYRL